MNFHNKLENNLSNEKFQQNEMLAVCFGLGKIKRYK